MIFYDGIIEKKTFRLEIDLIESYFGAKANVESIEKMKLLRRIRDGCNLNTRVVI